MTSYQLMVCIDDGSATAAVTVSNQVMIGINEHFSPFHLSIPMPFAPFVCSSISK